MTKYGRAPTFRTVEPTGPVRTFRQPMPVWASVNWDPPFADRQDREVAGWALAWSDDAALVAWMMGTLGLVGWLSASHVRRREAEQ